MIVGFRKGFRYEDSQLVIVPFIDTPTNSPSLFKDIYFNVNQYLSKQKIKAISIITQEEQPFLVQNGAATAVLNQDTNRNFVVTFKGCDKHGNKVTHFYKAPIMQFCKDNMDGSIFITDDIQIDLKKSYITINNMAGVSIGKYIYFVFFF